MAGVGSLSCGKGSAPTGQGVSTKVDTHRRHFFFFLSLGWSLLATTTGLAAAS